MYGMINTTGYRILINADMIIAIINCDTFEQNYIMLNSIDYASSIKFSTRATRERWKCILLTFFICIPFEKLVRWIMFTKKMWTFTPSKFIFTVPVIYDRNIDIYLQNGNFIHTKVFLYYSLHKKINQLPFGYSLSK